MSSRAVFLDRDGTIAKDAHYCCSIEDFEILPNVPQAIKLLNQHGFKIVVVTNQSGVGRGYFTEDTLIQIHEYMRRELAKHGAYVDAAYYCVHHPDDGCDCRKPKPGLLLKAAEELEIDLSQSFMVGDAERDIRAGKAAGCRTALIACDNGNSAVISPDFKSPDLLHAAQWVVREAAII